MAQRSLLPGVRAEGSGKEGSSGVMALKKPVW